MSPAMMAAALLHISRRLLLGGALLALLGLGHSTLFSRSPAEMSLPPRSGRWSCPRLSLDLLQTNHLQLLAGLGNHQGSPGRDLLVLRRGISRGQGRGPHRLHLADGCLGAGFLSGIDPNLPANGILLSVRPLGILEAGAPGGIGSGRGQMRQLMRPDLGIDQLKFRNLKPLRLGEHLAVRAFWSGCSLRSFSCTGSAPSCPSLLWLLADSGGCASACLRLRPPHPLLHFPQQATAGAERSFFFAACLLA